MTGDAQHARRLVSGVAGRLGWSDPRPENRAGEIPGRVETVRHLPTRSQRFRLTTCWEPPRIYGQENAGVVEAVGSRFRRFFRTAKAWVFNTSLRRMFLLRGAKLFSRMPGLQKGRRAGGI